jgi:AcrR family transcriptional regulator
MRKQRPRGSTTREAVVNGALAVADDVGIEALTLRAVAERVGAPPMSLYSHFASKEQLLDLMYAEVVRHLYADSGHPTWQAELVALCHQVRRVLLQHPHWAPLLARPAPQPSPMPLRERLLSLLTSDGMPIVDALLTVSNAGLVALGLTLVELNLRDPEGRSSVTARFDLLKTSSVHMPSNEEPLTREAVTATRGFELSDNFDAAIRAFVAGVSAEIRRSSATLPISGVTALEL